MGTVLQEFNNYQVSCQNPSIGQCYIILTLSNIPTTPSYNDYLNVSISNSRNQTSGIIYTSFSSTDSQPHIISQVVLKNDGYMNQTICNNSLSAVDGTISCTIPSTYQNSSSILKTYVDGTLKTISYLTQGTDPDWRGVDVFIELFMFSTLVLLDLGDLQALLPKSL